MAVEFVVETGAGLATATSYLSVADFRQFWENRGVSYNDVTYPDATVQGWLNLGTEYIDNSYKFYGCPTTPETQALQWPRTGTRDNKKNLISDTTIPKQLTDALCWIARAVVSTPDKELSTKVGDGIKSRKVGPVAVTYRDGYEKDYQTATNLLNGLIKKFAALRTLT